MKRLICVTAAAFAVLAGGGVVRAHDVLPGHDLWTTPAGGAFENFGANPIPADFFYPGSNPFTGNVSFVGQPIGVFQGQPTGPADTIVKRPVIAPLPNIGDVVTIPIELVALNLVSVNPIVVSGTQPPQQWDVRVTIPSGPPSSGQMTIRHTLANGGTYDSQIAVCPLFTFTQVGNPSNQRTLNACGAGQLPRQIANQNRPWVHQAVPPLRSPLSGPNFFPAAPGQHSGPHPGADPIEEPGGGPGVPTMSQWGLIVLALLLVTAGAIVFRRRRPALA